MSFGTPWEAYIQLWRWLVNCLRWQALDFWRPVTSLNALKLNTTDSIPSCCQHHDSAPVHAHNPRQALLCLSTLTIQLIMQLSHRRPNYTFSVDPIRPSVHCNSRMLQLQKVQIHVAFVAGDTAYSRVGPNLPSGAGAMWTRLIRNLVRRLQVGKYGTGNVRYLRAKLRGRMVQGWSNAKKVMLKNYKFYTKCPLLSWYFKFKYLY